ncbi:MAG: PUA domain-containing protein [Nitrososphaerales archaeon]
MRSYTLSKKDGNHVVDAVQSRWPNKPRFKAKGIRIVEVDEERALLIGEEFTAVKLGEDILPFLKMEELLETFGKIVVDKGAIRYVCNGANVMRPGVVQCEGRFESGDMVAVKEEQHGKLIAVGLALVDSSEIQNMGKGVVVKNMHYIGDKFWEAHKNIG